MTARQHHYLSQCYLKGFTKGKAKKSKLTVIDFKEKKQFETIPRNVGSIRDFNRVDIEGVDPNAIETALAGFENEASQALKRLDESLEFSGETKNLILNLIALLTTRSPERRKYIGNFETNILEKVMEHILHSKEEWEAREAQKKAENPEYESDIFYEDMKAFVDSKQYTIKFSTAHHIENEMTMINAILPCLYGRNWILFQSTIESGPFITTDNPVCLAWTEPEKIPPFYRASPGFGLKGTQVIFPVSKDLALVGEFDKQDGIITATKEVVSILNTIMIHNTNKQIYAPMIGFHFMSDDSGLVDGNRIMREMAG